MIDYFGYVDLLIRCFVDSMRNAITIMGIDPGYGITGFGVIKVSGSKLECLDYGVIRTLKGEDFSQRLKYLYKDLQTLIKKYNPDLVAVEELFFFKNVKTAIKVSHARGVILLTAIQAGKELVEFTPLQVKQAISCYGRADKLQVQKMVKTFLNLKNLPRPDDAADALAIAICASNCHRVS